MVELADEGFAAPASGRQSTWSVRVSSSSVALRRRRLGAPGYPNKLTRVALPHAAQQAAYKAGMPFARPDPSHATTSMNSGGSLPDARMDDASRKTASGRRANARSSSAGFRIV
jgi:hypothetical protein